MKGQKDTGQSKKMIFIVRFYALSCPSAEDIHRIGIEMHYQDSSAVSVSVKHLPKYLIHFHRR